jgi:hypothetical protein
MTTPTTYKLGYPKLKYPTVPFASGAPFQRNPTSSDLLDPRVGSPYQIGTLWPNEANDTIWALTSISGGTTANWEVLTESAGGDVVGPVSSTDNAIARFDGTTGKLIQNSTVTVADTTGTMTFPAGGGVVLTASGAAARKGSVTLTAGDSGAIATTAVAANSAISLTITALGTVTDPQPLYVTITPGVSFTITLADATDTSTITWAIVG